MVVTALPVELCYLVFDFLDQRDLKQVRLACRDLHRIVKIRIPRVFLSPNRANIDAFCGILANEKYCNQVREIVWDDARLKLYERSEQMAGLGTQDSVPHQANFDDFLGRISALTVRFNGGKAYPNSMSLSDNFDHHNRLYDEQQEIMEAGEDVETLMRGLSSFPALKRMTVSSEVWRIDPQSPRYETPFFRSLPSGFLMPQLWPWLGARNNEPWEPLALPWDEACEEWRGYRIAVDALLATTAHHRIEEFVIDTNHEYTGLGHQLFTSSNSLGYMKTVELFQTVQLTTLELSLNVITADYRLYVCLHNGLLKSALLQLKTLKHFAFSTSQISDNQAGLFLNPDGMISLEEIVPTELWCNLRSLKLCNLFLHGHSLYNALGTMTSLATVWIENSSLSNDLTWTQLMTSIKEQLVQGSGVWKPGKPDVVFRRQEGKDGYRLDSSAELREFLHGQGDCPFNPRAPWRSYTGWLVSDWDPEYRRYVPPEYSP